MALTLGSRRARFLDVQAEMMKGGASAIFPDELKAFEAYDLVYRTLCALLFNYVPTSGHPGGSISSGRMVHGILYNRLSYDLSNPDDPGADVISYAAGHKALGMYAGWALRNEVARIAAPSLLPKDERFQLRLEDLLGFRRNPTNTTPLFLEFNSKALDGHPKPNVPFIYLATGASGIGFGASCGLALAANDYFGAASAPAIHVIEGEGGLTPGRVGEALAMAATAGLKNLTVHLDFNQSSIDSDHVCRDDKGPGDYVQWSPDELFYLHDWNVIVVPDGMDFHQVFAAQKLAQQMGNSQPTVIVYKTVKGWRYGIEGKKSHGAGHPFASEGFYSAMKEFETAFNTKFPRFSGPTDPASVERSYWDHLMVVRRALEADRTMTGFMAGKLRASRDRLRKLGRKPRPDAPDVAVAYDRAKANPLETPAGLALAPGSKTTLRGTLGKVLQHLNQQSSGAFLVGSADLLESTGVMAAGEGFAHGYYHSDRNPKSRFLAMGGICEDGMGAIMTGISAYGRHVGVASSYAAFIAAMQHTAARLYGIASSARKSLAGDPYRPYIMVCGHAGYKTGEDGPSHADPQALQLLQGNFPSDICITLTPWDPQEIWALVTAALQARPAVISVFVTRPTEVVIDRKAKGLSPASETAKGVYAMRRADPSRTCQGTLVLQESGVTYAFVEQTLPKLDADGINLNIYYISSAELFDRLTEDEQERIFPLAHRREAMAITGFTMPTMYRWVLSEAGRNCSLHAFTCGKYPGSGQAYQVLIEAHLDGESQYQAIKGYIARLARVR